MGLLDLAGQGQPGPGQPPMPGPGGGPPGEVPPAGAPPAAEVPPEAQGPSSSEMGGEVDEQEVGEFVDACYQQIYGGQSADGELNPQLAAMLRQGGNPVEGLANAAAMIVSTEAPNQEGVTGEVLHLATIEMVGELADRAQEEGLYDYADEELESAIALATAQTAEQSQGIEGAYDTPGMVNDFNQLKSMSEDGSLDGLLGQVASGQDAMEAEGEQGGIV